MDSLNTILVAIDFSPSSISAFCQALRIAEWNKATIHACHVIALPALVPMSHPAVTLDIATQAQFVAQARARWDRSLAGLKLKTTTPLEIAIGKPRVEILNRVKRERPDLLILGAPAASSPGRSVGPVAGACIQRAQTKVLLVREGCTTRFNRVVACIDFTDTSLLALEQAIRVAALDSSQLRVLHIFDDPWHGIGPPESIRRNMPDFKERYRHAVSERVQTFCSPHAKALSERGAEFHVIESEWKGGGYGHAIVEYVKKELCDLAVLGTREIWNLRDFFWGSTAERVVRTAPCSILAVKPAGFEQPDATA